MAQRLDETVDAVAGDAEYRIDAPIDQSANENVTRRRRSHIVFPFAAALSASALLITALIQVGSGRTAPWRNMDRASSFRLEINAFGPTLERPCEASSETRPVWFEWRARVSQRGGTRLAPERWRSMSKALPSLLVLLFGLLICTAANAGNKQDGIAYGRYLATLGDCAICHTRPGSSGQTFAGGYPLHAYFGTVYSTNITPDRVTGIGSWTKDQFYRALHDGIAADGHRLYPAFPYAYFTALPRADSDALYAYLRTIKPVRYRPPPNKLIFPTNIRLGMTIWDWLFLDKSPFHADPAHSAAWNRGKWLVDVPGHCGGCHTAKAFFFSDKPGGYLRGETVDGWYAPDLTGAQPNGLGPWTAADIETYLKTGSNRFGRVVGAMKDVVRESTSRMSDADRAAIATYLKSLPAGRSPQIAKPDAKSMATGRTVFVERCSVCHAADTADYPALKNNSVVVQRDPATLLRVILQGASSIAVPGENVGYSMPAFPTLSNADLAAVATFVRNSWGNSAGDVTPKQAGSVRTQLRALN
ncbi:MAG: cytochrome c [Proteobacteria bacterium]|nr:cytochrome c [Pseudomonadota bacterium]